MHCISKSQSKTHENSTDRGDFCLECCTQVALSNNTHVRLLREILFVIGRVLEIGFEYLMSLLYAIHIILMAVFPQGLGQSRHTKKVKSVFYHEQAAEDQQRVAEINATIERVELGLEDPRKLVKMQNELSSFRSFELSRLEQREDRLILIDELSKKKRHLEFEARREAQVGNLGAAEDLRHHAINMQREIDCLYREINSI